MSELPKSITVFAVYYVISKVLIHSYLSESTVRLMASFHRQHARPDLLYLEDYPVGPMKRA